MNTLLTEVLQWLQNNNYRRASFDRIVGIVPSASTYDQLEQLVDRYDHIFRHANMKGGLRGLALHDDVSIGNTLLELAVDAPPPEMALTLGFGTVAYAATPPAPPQPIPFIEALPEPVASTPTVSTNSVEAEIVGEYYINAGEATGTYKGSLSRLTLCVLELRNEFTVVGKSACVYPEIYNEDKGRQLARADAVSQVWPLLGFRLADRRVNG